MAGYKYPPLPDGPGAKYIRLLTVHPGTGDTGIELEFSLKPVCIDNKPETPYEALSYVWGSEEDPVEVQMLSPDGKHLILITRNLAEALTHIRHPDRERIMWIDAVCINQSDNAEKGRQVAFMGDVYEKAERAIIWLGPEADNSERGLEIVEEIGMQVDVDWSEGTMAAAPGAADRSLAELRQPFSYSERDADAVEAIWRRSWFERVWVRQEISLSRSADFQIGTKTIPRLVFQNAAFCINQHLHGPERLQRLCGTERSWLVECMVQPPRRFTLPWLHLYTRGMKCKDARDRIFGLLRLIKGFEDSPIVPDYDASVAEVYIGAVLKYIEITQSVNIFADCKLSAGPRPHGLPTWVPDWSTDLDRNLNALPFSGGRTFLPVTSYRGDGVLTVGGHACEAVVSTSLLDASSRLATLKSFRQACFSLLPTTFREDYYSNDRSVLEVLCRTALLDLFDHSYYPPYKLFKSFEKAMDCFTTLLAPEAPPYGDPALRELEELGDRMRNAFRGRCFFTTECGRFGIGPSSTEPDDVVCLLLGSEMPIILKPVPSGQYNVVGDCFMHGIMSGEPFLGPLPAGLREVRYLFPESGEYMRHLLDENTGEAVRKDPRVRHLLFGLRITAKSMRSGGPLRYDVKIEELRRAGLDVEEFNLV
ncbi:heterokaryon incompatibility protein-domain-containing protein [Hypomontagnella monticulosa]|nr:heterokaryon incompatibility protein-domain-containing protein [Hypomontagnella monticulosa]